MLFQSLRRILDSTNYLVLKLYRGYNESKYEPQDVDIFLGKNIRRALYILKRIRKAFPESRALRRKHLSSSINVFIHGHQLEVDLYLEMIFSPIFILDTIPVDVKVVKIPWCEEIKVPSLNSSLNVLHLLLHSLRHKRLYDYEISSLIKELDEFDIEDSKHFILYVKEAGLENIMVFLLKLILYHSRFILRTSIAQYPSFYRNTLRIIKVLTKENSNTSFTDYIIRLTIRKVSLHRIGLWFVFPLYVIRSFVLAFRSLSKNSVNALLKIVFIYLFYEYIISLLHRLGFLR